MKLFKTKTRRTYHRPRQQRGWSTTSKASTRAKRWARRRTKSLWRRWKQHRRQQRRNSTYRRAASQPTPTSGGYQVGADGAVSYQPGATGTAAGQAKPPPPDGALASCRRCHNEVAYSGGNERWEHTGRGDAECFRRR